MSDPNTPIYRSGFAKLIRTLEKRQRPFEDAGQYVPALDTDLNALWHATVPATTAQVEDQERYNARRKYLELQKEFEGAPEILLVHALLIAVSRRDTPPCDALPLFFRIWREHGPRLAKILSVRWLISTATTFADCGENADQRALGMGLSTLFDLIKLHDTERRSTGLSGDALSTFVRTRDRPALGLNMPNYSIKRGDLDKVMLARFWQLAEREPTIRPLGLRMLNMIMTDQTTIFARMQAYKAAL